MLSEVFFLIDESNKNNEEFLAKLKDEADYIRKCGYGAEICFSEEDDNAGMLMRTGRNLSKSLVVTDSGVIAEELVKKRLNVVGMLHEANKGTGFPGVQYVFSDIDQVDMESFVKVYQRCVGEPWEILETERLRIRETTLEDVDEFYRLYAAPEMTRYMEGLFENPEDEKKYQKDYIDKVYRLMGFGVWTIIRKEDGAIIGRAGYSVRNGFEETELGFLIGKDYQRQGYCLEACRAILDYGRDMLLFDKVMTLVKAENLVSIHICEKLGFKRVQSVDVEEDIYGGTYDLGKKAVPNQEKYGSYVKMVRVF